MNKLQHELEKEGITGTVLFWVRFLLYGIPFGYLIFLIYWMVITGNQIWLNAIGGQILTTCLFELLVCIGSIVLLLFNHRKMIFKNPKFANQIYVIVTIVGFVINVILLSLSSTKKANVYLADISDYLERNANVALVVSFVADYPTSYSRSAFVRQRTTELYDVNAVFLVIWVVSLVVVEICNSIILKPDNEKLLSDQQAPTTSTSPTTQPNA